MGACSNSEAYQKSRSIDTSLKKFENTRSREVKILLLGPGESGKSTVFKQMKIILDDVGFTEEELAGYKHVVHSNCITEMRVLVDNAIKLRQPFQNQDNVNLARDLMNLPQAGNIWSAEIGQKIKKLWEDTGIKEVYKKRGVLFQLNDSAEYFFENIDRFIIPNYIPTVADVLRVRVRSTGIEEAAFIFDKLTFRVVDVGGQRSERRKWIHCFDCVTSVLFCAALNEYDIKLREDSSVNRVEEALNLFEDVANSNCFTHSSLILFLNKIDLFQEKIKDVPLELCPIFGNYEGGQDFQKACDFIRSRFVERVVNGNRVYVHFTCAINTENIEFVINDVKNKLLSEQTKEFVL